MVTACTQDRPMSSRLAWNRTIAVNKSCAAHVPFRRLPEIAFRGSMQAMSETVHKLTRRIEELQGAARKARLEAMQLAARLLTTSNSVLAGSPTNAHREGELAALRARYAGLVKIADEAQAQIDRLQAEEHERKYYR
jgi:predicted RNase H-like nuclease (RuvC/YqgF family)